MFRTPLADSRQREAGRSFNYTIGLRLPGDIPGYPACEPTAPGCCACAVSNTAAPPTSGRSPLSPPPYRDGTSIADSPAVILRHSGRPSAPPRPAKSAPFYVEMENPAAFLLLLSKGGGGCSVTIRTRFIGLGQRLRQI